MRKALLAAAALVTALSAQAAGAEGGPKAVASKIVHVTVYPEWAYVTREAEVDLAAGAARYSFRGLPAWIDEDSIRARVDSPADCVILGATTKTTYLARSSEAEVTSAEAAARKISDQIEDLNAEIEALAREKSYLTGLVPWKIAKAPRETAERKVDVAELREVKDFVKTELMANIKRASEIRRKVRDVQPELSAKQKALAELKKRSRLEKKEIIVEVDSKRARRGRISVRYLISGASWYPSYDARTDSEREKIAVTCKAIVQQSTGEDWTGAKFTLSTVQPYLSREKPELEPWYVGRVAGRVARPQTGQSYYNPRGISNRAAQGKMARIQRKWNDLQIMLDNEAATVRVMGNVSQAREVMRQVEERGTTVEFEIAGTYTVKADGKAAKLSVGQAEMLSKPRYSAAPAVSKSTYVIGAMRNSADFPLLPGPVRVYIDGSFIGKSAIDCVSENERFELYLGLEQRIKVTRDLDSKKSAVSRSGSRRRLVAAYTISVRNYLTKPVELEVTDQVPVSQDSSVKVKVLAIEPRTEVPDKGIITWPVELPAEGGAELRFEFQVDYPADVELPNAAAMEKWILAE